MTETELARLQELTAQRRWREVARMAEPLVRRRLDGGLFPAFGPLLTIKDQAIYKTAITIVGKMREAPPEAFDAVLSAWQSTWVGACPQCSREAMTALVALDRTNPRILDEIKRCLAVDNYQVQKECATALMAIDTGEARQILANFESYLPRQYTEKLVVDLLAKIRSHLASGP
jgi:hypothetical protein